MIYLKIQTKPRSASKIPRPGRDAPGSQATEDRSVKRNSPHPTSSTSSFAISVSAYPAPSRVLITDPWLTFAVSRLDVSRVGRSVVRLFGPQDICDDGPLGRGRK